MDIKNEIKAEDGINELKDKIAELEGLVEFTNYENIAYQRRIYLNFELLLDCSELLKKMKKEIGKRRFKEIHDLYLRTEKAQVMARQSEIAKTGVYGKMFKEIEQIFGNLK
jgi:sulfur relay (sulfurtransferase) DsrC/TusE family protein